MNITPVTAHRTSPVRTRARGAWTRGAWTRGAWSADR